MTPETANYIAKSSEELADARKMLAIGLSRHAARAAYYSSFHAAEAFIFERTGRIAKTHSGVRSEFARLLMQLSGDHRKLTSILSVGYKFKEIADYGIGTNSSISQENAEEAIEDAESFLLEIQSILG